MQPGMPQGFGTVGPDATPIFTLPGNPVSAYVSFEVFVRPVMRRMLGVEPLLPADRRARSAPRRCTRRRASGSSRAAGSASRTAATSCARSAAQGSHLVDDLAHANCLIVVPEATTVVPAGGTRHRDGAGAAADMSDETAAGGLTHRRRPRCRAHGRRLRQGRHGARRRRPPAASSSRPRWSRCCAATGVPKGDALAVARIAGIQARQAHARPGPAVPPDRDPRRRRSTSRSPTTRVEITRDGAHGRPHRRRDGGADLRRGRRARADRHGQGGRPGRRHHRRAGRGEDGRRVRRLDPRRRGPGASPSARPGRHLLQPRRGGRLPGPVRPGPRRGPAPRSASTSTGRWSCRTGPPVEAALRDGVADGYDVV